MNIKLSEEFKTKCGEHLGFIYPYDLKGVVPKQKEQAKMPDGMVVTLNEYHTDWLLSEMITSLKLDVCYLGSTNSWYCESSGGGQRHYAGIKEIAIIAKISKTLGVKV